MSMTVPLGNGYHIEMGAEWIHGQVNNSVYELVQPLGLLIEEEEEIWKNGGNDTYPFEV